MRVAIGGIMHESNTFAATPTPLAAFSVLRGVEIEAAHRESYHEVAGFLQGGADERLELVPTLFAGATPAGPVAADAFAALVDELIERVRAAGPLDGILLALHGAMAVEGCPDGDGEVVQRLRAAVGTSLPIVATHDFLANIADRLVALTDALVVYQTNPHVDQRQQGVRAARLLARRLRGEIRPTTAIARPPMLLNILHQNTSCEPLRAIMAEAAALETEPGVLAASVAGGYQYADVWEIGPAAVVVTDNDPDRARLLAERLCARLWDARGQLTVSLPGPAAAVREAMRVGATAGPTVLVDMGDNIGGGSAGDSTFLLGELLSQGAEGWVVVLADPTAVAECVRAGVGQPVVLSVGGKTDALHGSPIRVSGRVRLLHDGAFEDHAVRHGGQRRYHQGLTAVVGVGGEEAGVGTSPPTPTSPPPTPNLLVLTSRRMPPFSLEQLVSLGIHPERQRILVVKAAIAYRAAYEPIAARIIEVDTPGLTTIDPGRFTYARARRPLWGGAAGSESGGESPC